MREIGQSALIALLYLPLKKADWSEETAKNKTFLIQQNLVDDLGEIPLNNFDKFTLQTQINKLALPVPQSPIGIIGSARSI